MDGKYIHTGCVFTCDVGEFLGKKIAITLMHWNFITAFNLKPCRFPSGTLGIKECHKRVLIVGYILFVQKN